MTEAESDSVPRPGAPARKLELVSDGKQQRWKCSCCGFAFPHDGKPAPSRAQHLRFELHDCENYPAMPEFENLRTDEKFRAEVEEETRRLRDAGFSDRDISIWLAGARWASRVWRIILSKR